jgi:hypothetical protein
MKKIIVPIALTMAALLTSCGSFGPKAMVKTTATHTRVSATTPVVAVFADLEVSPTKISYFYLPSKTIAKGGYDNVVNAAVREALASNGDGDVIVGLETQVKYDDKSQIESITITGYPAKYVNFRNPGDEYLSKMNAAPAKQESNGGGALGGLKLGK